MSALNLHSCLAAQIQNFINLRCLSGTDYQSQAQLLGYFDRFVLEQQLSEPRITREITECYQQSLSHLAPRTRYNRFCVAKQLCEYLARNDPLSYVPEPLKVIPSQGAHQPYIYSNSELQALLAAASELPPANSLRPHTYRTLLGVLYSTGIRIGEALALNLEHFHSAKQRLHIAEGKFRKARLAPLSASTCRALEQYLRKRLQMKPRSPDSPLLLNQRSRRLHHSTVNQTFRHLLRQCTIHHSKHTGPRIHDLRHTFAVHRLLAWYRDGQNVNARLPWLATYMGHVDIHSTQLYLRATPELIEQVDRRFHNHYLHQVKPHGGKK
ncbi:MAG: tyrosine-type recombinase/integrase [Deltaproteobacteria bacterium]|nr:tyrosine-type recombinase/integrase [Deltaproteobacteria bacterium]